MNAIKRNIPNAITCLNLLFGCVALVFIFQDRLADASWVVIFAGVADFFDGMAARILNVSSPIGKELDSLADMVSFGVVPGMMVFQLLGDPSYRWIAMCIPVFAAIRLAKFNIDTRQATYFIGVPTPAIAFLVASFPLIIFHNDYWNTLYISDPTFDICFFSTLSIVCAALMVMPMPLLSLKFKNLSWADNKTRYILMVLWLASVVIFHYAAVPIIFVLYVVFSLFDNPAKAVHE